jgi:putative transposase
MLAILDSCRWLYNQLLEQRKTLWETSKKGISLYVQQAGIPKLTIANPSLDDVYSQTKQNVAVRIDLAFKAFFRRCKSGEKPGYPRFRGKGWYNSFTYPQANNSFKLTENDTRIYLSKIGHVKIAYHRKTEGILKTCVVKRSLVGKWYVCISCDDVPRSQVSPSSLRVGIDVGLKTFATFSDGTIIENPRFFKQSEKALAKTQRKLAKQTKGTLERAKARKVVAKVYEKMANRRDDFTHKESRRIVNTYGTICVEDLDIKSMIVNGQFPSVRRGIADVAWAELHRKTEYKAESAGRQFVKDNPAYTSQDCSDCGNRQVMKLSDRTYNCPVCGLSLDRDLNASRNILAVGLHSLANRKVA